MFDEFGLGKIILFLQVEPGWVILMAGVSLLFVLSLIRKLLKMALVLMLVLVGIYYYVDKEATAFWSGQSETLKEAVTEAGHGAVERGLEILEEVIDKDLVQRADELKLELQEQGGATAERGLRLLDEVADEDLMQRANELKQELQEEGGAVAEHARKIIKEVSTDDLFQRAKEMKHNLQEELGHDEKTDKE